MYWVAIVARSNFYANIISPVNALLAAAILWFVYQKSRQSGSQKTIFLFDSLACLSWGIADIGWAIMDLYHLDAENSTVLWVLYAIPNLLLEVGILTVIIKNLNRWSIAQMVVDSLSILLVSGITLWIIYFENDLSVLFRFLGLDFTSLASVLLDFLIGLCILQWLVSIRKGNLSPYLQFVTIGTCLYVLIDMAYYYLTLHDAYMPNGMIDFLYAMSFFLMAIGAAIYCRDMEVEEKESAVTNIGMHQRWVILCVIAAAVVALQAFGMVAVEITLLEIFAFTVVVLENWSMSRYIQLSIENARLYERTRSMNTVLEVRVTEQKEMLYAITNQDMLTGFYNRNYFMNMLESELSCESRPQTVCLMILDIDRLRVVNENFGTNTGDYVIVEFAKRIAGWNMHKAIIARINGDEFGIYITGTYTYQQVSEFCQELLSRMCLPVRLAETQLAITASLGAAILTGRQNSGDTLWNNANIALDQAKLHGYGKYQIFDPAQLTNKLSTSRIEMMLKLSDIEKDFELYYQPQFALPSQKLVGAEALLRWKNPQGGYVSTATFIPIAEVIGFIHPMGKWVLRAAMLQAKQWNQKQKRGVKVAINISPVQLKENDLVDYIRQQMAALQVEPDWLDMEITESAMLEKDEHTQTVLSQIRNLGLTLSVDDFGSGHASFGYLSDSLFHKVKIDKTLIDQTKDMNVIGTNVVKTIIDMAKQLGVQTIAEGVETREQLSVLTFLGCDQVQGFLLGRPVQAAEFEQIFLPTSARTR